MKIGILTYHRTENYGGCLQALATRLKLENMGHVVYYIDYWPYYHKQAYSIFNSDSLRSYNVKGKIAYIFNRLIDYKYLIARKRNFNQFHNKHTFPYCKSVDEPFDVVVYGSDQIWRKQVVLKDYNPFYFADNSIKSNCNVAFSASMGVLPSSGNDIERIKAYLLNFDYISVREKSLQELLSGLGIKDIELTLDPTFLLNSKEWDSIFAPKHINREKYILVYHLWGDTFNMQKVRDFAEKNQCAVKVIVGNASHKESNELITTAGPEEFIDLIRNAKYVFSSSFHGVAFSLIYHKNFYASFSKNGGRAQSLLALAGIPERYVEPLSDFEISANDIDYESVDEKISFLRNETIHFLEKSISY